MTIQEWMNRGRVLDDQIYKLQTEYIAVQGELLDAIRKLPDTTDRAILIAYYCAGKTWNEIAEEFQLTRQQIYRNRDAALNELEKIIRGNANDCLDDSR